MPEQFTRIAHYATKAGNKRFLTSVKYCACVGDFACALYMRFCSCFTREECGYFIEVGKKILINNQDIDHMYYSSYFESTCRYRILDSY